MKKSIINKTVFGSFILLAGLIPFLFISSCQKEEQLFLENEILKSGEITNGESVLYWGHHTFTRETGKPAVVKLKIGSENLVHFEPGFVLHLKNGDGTANLVSSAVIKLDGKQIFGPSDFSKKVTTLSKEITGLNETSELEVELRSTPGSYIEVWIEGTLKIGHFVVDICGGTFSIDESNNVLNGFRLVVPEGFTDVKGFISVTEAQNHIFDLEKLIQIGPMIEIKFDGSQSTFSKYCTITLPIRKQITDIPLVGYYNEEIKNWEFLNAMDSENNSGFVFQTNHFSVYTPFLLKIELMKIIESNINTFNEARLLLNSQTIDPVQACLVTQNLQIIKEESLDNMYKMRDAYDDCKNQYTCKMTYEELENFIAKKITTKSTSLILTNTVLAGDAAGILIVKSAFLIGDIVTSALLVDCISCFIPNSIVGYEFWLNNLQYHLSSLLIEKIDFDCETKLFEDNFNDLSKWTLYGSPSPVNIANIKGRTGVFDNNGDHNYNSGAISKDKFTFSKNMTIESEVYLDFSDMSGCWAAASIGIANPVYQYWGGYDANLVFSLNATGSACWDAPPSTFGHAYASGLYLSDNGWTAFTSANANSDNQVNADAYKNKWSKLKVVIDASGVPSCYIDDDLIFQGTVPIASSLRSTALSLWLGERSSGSAGKAYHDCIKVYEN